MNERQKNLASFITIVVATILSIIVYQNEGEWIRINYDPHDPVQQFIGVLFLTSATIFFRIIKKKPKYEPQANLWEWFMITLIPTPIAFSAVIHSGISLYWGLFAFVLASTMWISIGVYNGTHYEKKWDVNYKGSMIIGIIMLIGIGVVMQLLFSFIGESSPLLIP